ncbi:hypothetical protein WJX72_007247 [[Myrmecia] bisecta]|uniref:Uncharacterized protein n=1 Tax=[Myrmecia] bisecta TaxID=41462 RepID=A0AAW1P3J4_9CHLO
MVEAFVIVFGVLLLSAVIFLMYHCCTKRRREERAAALAARSGEAVPDVEAPRPLAPILVGIFVSQPDGHIDVAVASNRSSSEWSAGPTESSKSLQHEAEPAAATTTAVAQPTELELPSRRPADADAPVRQQCTDYRCPAPDDPQDSRHQPPRLPR